MNHLEVDGRSFTIRRATRGDVSGLVQLLRDDVLGAGRESVSDLRPYDVGFTAIDEDPPISSWQRSMTTTARSSAPSSSL